uniref:Uncharacterized protein LOC105070226 isoform X3 n=1 Tax=Camelus bactrianus TaxID=9837 RepID=A0A9W3HJ38_CAMBA|nr:uncharacterized protein LOC105070226 isoform X3 [Camelus bactrianus]
MVRSIGILGDVVRREGLRAQGPAARVRLPGGRRDQPSGRKCCHGRSSDGGCSHGHQLRNMKVPLNPERSSAVRQQLEGRGGGVARLVLAKRRQQAPVSGKVFIQRDYSSGTRCQFQTKLPAEPENRVMLVQRTTDHT